MAAILCHMTSKPLVQSKDNEINRDIKFCPSIPQCSGDIALSNNFNLINPTFKLSLIVLSRNVLKYYSHQQIEHYKQSTIVSH